MKRRYVLAALWLALTAGFWLGVVTLTNTLDQAVCSMLMEVRACE